MVLMIYSRHINLSKYVKKGDFFTWDMNIFLPVMYIPLSDVYLNI